MAAAEKFKEPPVITATEAGGSTTVINAKLFKYKAFGVKGKNRFLLKLFF